MRSLLLAVLAAYVVASIHSILAFVNKRKALQRVSHLALVLGFVLHTTALIADWALDGHYPLFNLRETLSFLAWTLAGVTARGFSLQGPGARSLRCHLSPCGFVAILIAPDLITRRPAGFQHLALSHHTTHVFLMARSLYFFASIIYLLQERD